MMLGNKIFKNVSFIMLLAAVCWVAQAQAVTWDLATDFDAVGGSNGHVVSGATWEYGVIDILGDFQPLTNQIADYNLAGGGPNPAWVEANFNVPPGPSDTIHGIARNDTTVDAGIPGWTTGQVGGHTPASDLHGQALAVRWTAPAGGGTYDVIGTAWQSGVYPEPPTPPQDGDRRIHHMQLLNNGSLVHHAPITTRRGLTNPAGGSPIPEAGDNISDITNPTTIRTRQALAGGEQLLFRVGRQAANSAAFMNFNLNINSVLTDNTSWDLSRDYSLNTAGGTATGIGPDNAWSYGVLGFGGSFQAFDEVSDSGGVTIHGVPNWEVASGGPAVPILTKTPDGVNGVSYGAGIVRGDTPANSVVAHVPNATVSPTKTASYQWTAPRSMTINIEAELWKANLVEAAGPLRNHGYDIVHNGTVIRTGGILEHAQGGNSGDPTKAQISSLAVNATDTVELRVRALDGNTETFVGSHFRINEGAATGVAGYVHSAALDLSNDFSSALPQDNPNGDWAYFAADDTTGSLVATNGGSPVNTFGAGAGWADPTGVPSYARANHPWATVKEGILGHGPQKVVWTAPADIDAGGVELTGFLEQIFEDSRQMELRIYKNDTAGAGTPIASVAATEGSSNPDADFDADGDVDGGDFLIWQDGFGTGTTQPEGDANFSGGVDGTDLGIWNSEYNLPTGSTALNSIEDLPVTQVEIVPGDTLTIFVSSSSAPGYNPASTFSNWDVIIREVAFPLAAAASVPEPSTTLLFMVGCLSGSLVRRRRK